MCKINFCEENGNINKFKVKYKSDGRILGVIKKIKVADLNFDFSLNVVFEIFYILWVVIFSVNIWNIYDNNIENASFG